MAGLWLVARRVPAPVSTRDATGRPARHGGKEGGCARGGQARESAGGAACSHLCDPLDIHPPGAQTADAVHRRLK